MPEVLDYIDFLSPGAEGDDGEGPRPDPPVCHPERSEGSGLQHLQARRDLRRQIARLEQQLGVLSASRDGMPSAGPRVLDIEHLERVRDSLVDRVHIARDELAARAHTQERSRELLQRMLAAPQRHRWMRISRDHLGEPGCGHWHSRPVLGPIGMLMGWWRVKVSSGCP